MVNFKFSIERVGRRARLDVFINGNPLQETCFKADHRKVSSAIKEAERLVGKPIAWDAKPLDEESAKSSEQLLFAEVEVELPTTSPSTSHQVEEVMA